MITWINAALHYRQNILMPYKGKVNMGRAALYRQASFLEFIYGKAAAGAAAVWAKVQALSSSLTPPAARSPGVHFGQARIPHFEKALLSRGRASL